MNLQLINYLKTTGIRPMDLAKEIEVSRQRVEKWLERGAPVIIDVDPFTNEVQEVRIEKNTVIYSIKGK